MTEIFWSAVGAIGGLFALAVSYLAYRERHNATVSSRGDARVKQIVGNEMSGIILKQAELTGRLNSLTDRLEQIATDQHEQARRIGALLDRTTVLETKTEVFWRNVSMDAAKIIHSPDPRRAHIDALLESFMNGNLSPADETELRDILEVIRDYEPGVSHLTFPVYPGEQIAAAILLRTLDVEQVGDKGEKR